MIGFDRTANVLAAPPSSSFPWPPGDDSTPPLSSMTTTNATARHTTNKADAASPRRQSSLTPAPDSSSPHSRMLGKSPGVESENARSTGLGDEGGMPSPLSELSAPEDDEEDADEKEGKADAKSEAGASNASLHTNGVSKKHANAEASSSSSPLRGPHPPLANSAGSAPRPPNPNAPRGSRKIDVLVHINGELFKALEEFGKRSIPMDDGRCAEYSGRLQTNLQWLASAADSPQPLAPRHLPNLSPPPAVEFVQMDQLVKLYRDLNAAFARDPARPPSHMSPQGAQMPPGSLKRERTEHATPEPMNKRRDTGEHKAPMLPPSTPVPIGRGFPPGVAPGTPQMVGSSPQIPQQGFNNPTQADMARRAQQLQQREQMMRAQQAQQQQRPNQASPSQMQPPPVPGMGAGAGGAPGGPQNNPQVQAILAQYGQNGLHAMKILQTPQHPAMQQILKSIPTFFNQPLHMQITSIIRFMTAMNQQQQPQQNAGGGMQMPGGPGSIPLSRMGSGAQPGAPMGVPSQGNMSQPLPPGSGMGNLTQQQLMTLRPEQRQMYMMQQQRMGGAPGGGGGGGGGGMQGGMQGGNAFGGGAGQGQGGINPAAFAGVGGGQGGINPAMLQQQQQQHRMMQQQQASQQQFAGVGGGMGSPVHASPPAGGDFGGMHGRGTHSPSENAPSPMTPRGGPGGNAADFQRVMAMQAAQANASSPAPGSGGGFINPQQMMAGGGGGWPAPSNSTYGGTPPGSAHGRPQQQQQQQQQYAPSAPSPSAGGGGGGGGSSGWPGGGFPYAPSPVGQMGGQQQRPPSRTASAAGGGFAGLDPSGGGSPAVDDFSDFLNIQGW